MPLVLPLIYNRNLSLNLFIPWIYLSRRYNQKDCSTAVFLLETLSLQKENFTQISSQYCAPIRLLYILTYIHRNTSCKQRKMKRIFVKICLLNIQSKINAAEEWFDERKIFGFRVLCHMVNTMMMMMMLMFIFSRR